ncbi:hypothetical protein BKA93DRAFT_722239 [Sparassis latifolia]
MSRHILRQTRFSHSLCSAFITVPPRRCYAALASRQALRDQEVEPQQALPVAHNAPEVDLTSTPSSIQESKASLVGSGKRKKSSKKSSSADASEEASKPPSETRTAPGVEQYLASIHAAGLEPTISDLERCRPAEHAHTNSPQYPLDYNALVDTLCRSFSKAQLRHFLETSNVGSTSSRYNKRKLQYAEAIVEKLWGWPSLKEIERAKRDRTEVSVRSFPVTPSQMFLILGRDGADLLEMSMEFNVHISLTTNPLALRVEGLRGSLDRLSQRITFIEQDITSETMELPTKTPVRQDLVQRISRLAGAYLENVDHKGKVRIYARNRRNLDVAKRLASRAGHESNSLLQPPVLSYLPSEVSASTPVATLEFPHSYFLYPFLSPRSLPWTMSTGGTFRVRRIGEWLGPSSGEDIESSGGLAGGRGRILAPSGDVVDLKTLLLNTLSDSPHSTSRSIKASTGHMLFTALSPGQRPNIVPPLKGHHTFTKILQWMTGSSAKSSFVSSLPAALVDSSPAQQKVLHRLTYRALPQPVQEGSSSRDIPPDPAGEAIAHSSKVLSFEVVLAQPRLNTLDPNVGDSLSRRQHSPLDDIDADVPLLNAESTSRCAMGSEVVVDLMMPDRPMDLRVTAFESNELTPGEEPAPLQGYMEDLRTFMMQLDSDVTQPDPPLLFHYRGDTYMLHASATVRQSVELIKAPTHSDGNALDRQSIVRAVSESILDLESTQKSTQCEVTCDDYLSDDSWKHFLSDCDKLTIKTYKPVGNITVEPTDNAESI